MDRKTLEELVAALVEKADDKTLRYIWEILSIRNDKR